MAFVSEAAANSIPSQSPGAGAVALPLLLLSPPTESSWIEVNVAPLAISVPLPNNERAAAGKLTPNLMMAPGWIGRVRLNGTVSIPART